MSRHVALCEDTVGQLPENDDGDADDALTSNDVLGGQEIKET